MYWINIVKVFYLKQNNIIFIFINISKALYNLKKEINIRNN